MITINEIKRLVATMKAVRLNSKRVQANSLKGCRHYAHFSIQMVVG